MNTAPACDAAFLDRALEVARRAARAAAAIIDGYYRGGAQVTIKPDATPVTQADVEAEAAIRAAQEVGAQGVPKAALHLKMARDDLDRAQRLIGQDENEEAKLVLERARVDAELAIALAKESALRAQAADALEKVKKLKAEAEGSS